MTVSVSVELHEWSAVFEPRAIDVAGTDFVVVCEVWDRNDYRVPASGFSGTVLDVGANVGAFTVLAAKAGARVVAVEPVATNRERLEHHVELNDVGTQVVVLPLAVIGGDAPTVRMTGDGGGARVADDGEHEVQACTLDDLLNAYAPIELLKVDIEGGEFAMFDAIPTSALNVVDRIALEWHGPVSPHLTHLRGDEFAPLVTKLADCGRVETFGHPASGGLLHWHRY